MKIARAIMFLAVAMMLAPVASGADLSFSRFINATAYNQVGGGTGPAPSSTTKIRLIKRKWKWGTAHDQNKTYGTNSGGEFIVQWTDTEDEDGNALGATSNNWRDIGYPANDDIYKTYCTELNEFIKLGKESNVTMADEPNTYVATIDNQAWYGSKSTSGPDNLTKATEFLFSLYVTGQLDTFNSGNGTSGFSYTSNTAANNLQSAFWHFADNNPATANALAAWALNEISGLTEYQWRIQYGLLGDVKVLNLWEGITQNSDDEWEYKKANARQSQLIYVPPGFGGQGGPVPEPATMTLWAFGLAAGLYGYRRRRKQA